MWAGALDVYEKYQKYGSLLNRPYVVNFKCYGSFEVICIAANDVRLEASARQVVRSCVVCCHRTIAGETYTRLNSAS